MEVGNARVRLARINHVATRVCRRQTRPSGRGADKFAPDQTDQGHDRSLVIKRHFHAAARRKRRQVADGMVRVNVERSPPFAAFSARWSAEIAGGIINI